MKRLSDTSYIFRNGKNIEITFPSEDACCEFLEVMCDIMNDILIREAHDPHYHYTRLAPSGSQSVRGQALVNHASDEEV
jgi:hypothetical protein